MYFQPNTVSAAGTPCSITPVLTEANLDTCIAEAPTDNSEFAITIGASFSLSAVKAVTAGKNITISSNVTGGIVLSLQSGNTAQHFNMQGGGQLTLASGVTLQGNGPGDPWDAGGGVIVYTGSTFNMTGGTITGTTYGVYVTGAAGATFTMSGGTISQNKKAAGGGVYIENNNTFNMTGGWITGNTATNIGGGIYAGGGGTTVNISGGEISGNTAITHGGGIANGATLNMSGGKISGNTSSTGGGGVANYTGATFTMSGGEISGNNSLESSGGIANGGTFNMSGNAIISGNTATLNGGGIANSGTITMTGGTINGNTTGNYGGGINVGGTASVTITGGQITNNTAGINGGGVNIAYDNLANLTVGAGAVFAGNSASVATRMRPADQALYNAQIATTSFSLPLPFNGYNNYDISYASDLPTNICQHNQSLWADDTKCVAAPGTGLFSAQIGSATVSTISIIVSSIAITILIISKTKIKIHPRFRK